VLLATIRISCRSTLYILICNLKLPPYKPPYLNDYPGAQVATLSKEVARARRNNRPLARDRTSLAEL
jgi:hypothetical protein